MTGRLPRRAADVDRVVLLAVRGSATPATIAAATALSHFGEHALGWLALGAAGAAAGGRRQGPDRRTRWLRAAGSVALAHGANIAVKRIVRRTRPELPGLPPLVATPSRLSFPSAHAASTFAAAAAYGPLAPRVPWYAAAGGMALSRVLLGVHYPSDVLAGALLGTAVGRTLGRSAPTPRPADR